MKKTYLIDSENINDIWVEILHCLEDKDEILVFYTVKSAHMGYDRIIKLMEHKRGTIRWIRCFEGQNALDFQLVTELGSRIGQDSRREYIIVSNDTGYDAVVRYWQQKEYRVRRMKSVECENLPEVRNAEAHNAELQNAEVQNTNGQNAEISAASLVKKDNDSVRGWNKEEGNAEAKNEAKAEENAEEPGRKETKKKAQKSEERKKGRKKLSELRAERMRRQAEEAAAGAGTLEKETTDTNVMTPEAVSLDTASLDTEPSDIVTPDAIISDNAALNSENLDTMIFDIVASGGETEAQQVQSEAGSTEHVSFVTADSWYDTLDAIFRENGSQDSGADIRYLTDLCKTIKLSDMSMVHNVLEYHFGQERGNAVYRFIKENPGCRGELSAGYSNNKKQRERQYLNLILKRNHIIAEEGELDAILKILGGIPRKNLNGIHVALVKRFGQEHGGTCYAVLRNHVKILRSL